MRKNIILLTFSFATLLLVACQSQDKQMTMLDEISPISISESEGYGGINENYFKYIDNDELILTFEDTFKNAKGKKHKVDTDTEKPDYDILIRYENGETNGLHLLLGSTEETSRVMYVGYENNGFDISSEDAKKLRNILENQ